MSQLDNEPSVGSQSCKMEAYDDGDSEEDADANLPNASTNSTVYKGAVTSTPVSNSVLANCPDITIIKKEKMEGLVGKMNNNSDHSDRQSGDQ